MPLVVGFIILKSALASRQAKELAARRLGERARNGLYRPLYFLFSGVGAVFIVRRVYREPHNVIYEVKPPFSYVMRAGQAACVAATLEATRVIGGSFSGFTQIKAFVTGGDAGPESEAQGPPLKASGELSSSTVFGITRHPNNWFPTSIFLLEPKMTNKRAAFCALTALHGLIGSVHEEYRLKAAYGRPAYERYMKKAPFLFSLPGRGRR
ncbi:MAG: hypothetical protein ACRD2W_04095 [Acidimicrobiales bacterium]